MRGQGRAAHNVKCKYRQSTVHIDTHDRNSPLTPSGSWFTLAWNNLPSHPPLLPRTSSAWCGPSAPHVRR